MKAIDALVEYLSAKGLLSQEDYLALARHGLLDWSEAEKHVPDPSREKSKDAHLESSSDFWRQKIDNRPRAGAGRRRKPVNDLDQVLAMAAEIVPQIASRLLPLQPLADALLVTAPPESWPSTLVKITAAQWAPILEQCLAKDPLLFRKIWPALVFDPEPWKAPDPAGQSWRALRAVLSARTASLPITHRWILRHRSIRWLHHYLLFLAQFWSAIPALDQRNPSLFARALNRGFHPAFYLAVTIAYVCRHGLRPASPVSVVHRGASIHDIAIDPCSEILAVGRAGAAELFRLSDGAALGVRPASLAKLSLAALLRFHPTDEKLYIGWNDAGEGRPAYRFWLEEWDFSADRSRPLLANVHTLREPCFLSEDFHLAAICDDCLIQFWDMRSHRLSGFCDPGGVIERVLAVWNGFLPGGEYFGAAVRSEAGSYDLSYAIWDVPSGKLLRRLDPIPDAVLVHQGLHILAICRGGSLEIFDARTLSRLHATTIDTAAPAFDYIRLSPSGRYFIAATGSSVFVWDWAAGTPVRRLPGPPSFPSGAVVQGIDLSADECWLTAITRGQGIFVWDLTTGRLHLHAQVSFGSGISFFGFLENDRYGIVKEVLENDQLQHILIETWDLWDPHPKQTTLVPPAGFRLSFSWEFGELSDCLDRRRKRFRIPLAASYRNHELTSFVSLPFPLEEGALSAEPHDSISKRHGQAGKLAFGNRKTYVCPFRRNILTWDFASGLCVHKWRYPAPQTVIDDLMPERKQVSLRAGAAEVCRIDLSSGDVSPASPLEQTRPDKHVDVEGNSWIAASSETLGLIAGARPYEICLWEIAGGRELARRRIDLPDPVRIVLAPANNALYIGAKQGLVVRLDLAGFAAPANHAFPGCDPPAREEFDRAVLAAGWMLPETGNRALLELVSSWGIDDGLDMERLSYRLLGLFAPNRWLQGRSAVPSPKKPRV